MKTYDQQLTSLDLESWIKNASPMLQQELWMMEHFRVLPTDPRLETVTPEQSSILWAFWLMKAQDDAFKMAYWKQRQEKAEHTISEQERTMFRDIGYTAEQIAAIEGAL